MDRLGAYPVRRKAEIIGEPELEMNILRKKTLVDAKKAASM